MSGDGAVTPGQAEYEAFRSAIPGWVCNVPGGPWDELSEPLRAGFAAIAAMQAQTASETRWRIVVNATGQGLPGDVFDTEEEAASVCAELNLRSGRRDWFGTRTVQSAVGPCPGCESLRRQCSELAGEVGGLAGALTDIRDANPDAPAGGYAMERARITLDALHGSKLVAPGSQFTDWAVFWGGDHPDDCAGLDLRDDEEDAEEHAQWFERAGICTRTVTRGPWTVTRAPAAALLNATQERHPSREVHLITDDERDDPEEP